MCLLDIFDDIGKNWQVCCGAMEITWLFHGVSLERTGCPSTGRPGCPNNFYGYFEKRLGCPSVVPLEIRPGLVPASGTSEPCSRTGPQLGGGGGGPKMSPKIYMNKTP